MVKPVFLDFDFSTILSADYTSVKGGFEQPLFKDEGIDLPKSYCFENTKVHMVWWDRSQIAYDDIGHQLGLDLITVSSIMKEPGTVFPLHRDNFNNPLWDQTRIDQLVRVLICLEDCKIGHIIQYIEDGKCRTRANWVAGDGFMWDSQVPHLTVNAGMQPKYTMQITGFLNK
jgi:hypothetical protein